MRIFEPDLCCKTCVCGVSVDPELLRITTRLNTLKPNGVVIDRFNLDSAPMQFVTNHTINMFVNEKGVEALPCATVDGKIIIKGRYPRTRCCCAFGMNICPILFEGSLYFFDFETIEEYMKNLAARSK